MDTDTKQTDGKPVFQEHSVIDLQSLSEIELRQIAYQNKISLLGRKTRREIITKLKKYGTWYRTKNVE